MSVNADKPTLWKADIALSIDQYNTWFMQYAPQVYRTTRAETAEQVKRAFEQTNNLTAIAPSLLQQHPRLLTILRMLTAPPIARDRLIGLAGVSANLVESMEKRQRIPPQMDVLVAQNELTKIGQIILKLIDKDLFPWLESLQIPAEQERDRAASVVADRLCGAATDPIVRNAQEARQLAIIKDWLEQRGYSYSIASQTKYDGMPPGTFTFRLNIPGMLENSMPVHIPVDVIIMPFTAATNDLPLFIEAKSAGDFTNTNKRQKEEGMKIAQLRRRHGDHVRFILFLCGYFDTRYLGYEAAEGIDWLWEHRVEDLIQFGV